MDFDFIPEQANLSVDIGSGSVLLSSDKLPKIGKINVELGYGDSQLFFPKREIFGVDFSSAWGKMTSEIPIAEKSDFFVHVSAGIGKLKVQEKKK